MLALVQVMLIVLLMMKRISLHYIATALLMILLILLLASQVIVLAYAAPPPVCTHAAVGNPCAPAYAVVDKALMGATAKLLSNSSYGSLLLNQSRFTNTSFECGKQKC